MFSCLRRYLSRSLEVTSLLGDAARTTFATIMWRKCKSLGRSENGVCGGSIPFQETAVITVLLFTVKTMCYALAKGEDDTHCSPT